MKFESPGYISSKLKATDSSQYNIFQHRRILSVGLPVYFSCMPSKRENLYRKYKSEDLLWTIILLK